VDSIVAVTIPVAEDHLFRQVRENFREVHLVGDALSPRGIEEAIFDGHRLGREL
jgi:3-dehydroquinate dehydratase